MSSVHISAISDSGPRPQRQADDAAIRAKSVCAKRKNYWPCLNRRTPRTERLRKVGLPYRHADRVDRTLPVKMPPRTTRASPVLGPVGST